MFMSAHRRDFIAGLATITLGLAVTAVAATYKFGTLERPGPGLLPVALGVLLAVVGLLIAIASRETPANAEGVLTPDWMGCTCIVLGIAAFGALASFSGLVPACFACVFISALGDRTTTWKNALALALGITAAGALLFGFVLQLPLPLFFR